MTQRSTKIFAENLEIVEVFDGIIEGAEFSTFSRKSRVFIFEFTKKISAFSKGVNAKKLN